METNATLFDRLKFAPKLTSRKIALMGIMVAIRIVMGYIPGLNFGNLVQIGVGFIGAAFTGVLFGPVYAAVVSVIADILTFFLSGSGVFFPGFTLSAAMGGIIYASVLWRKEKTLTRVFIAVLLVTLIVNLGMNSLWVKMLSGNAWSVFMGMRVIKNAISLPLNTLILYVILNISQVKRLIKEFQF